MGRARRAGHGPGLTAAGPLVCLALLAGCAAGAGSPRAIASSPLAAGERVYQDGVAPDGSRIGRIGGVAMPMAGDGCAACHGSDGRGRATMMVTAPDITYGNLTNPAGMLETDGSRGPGYTDALIRRAVIAGVGADGDELDRTMPRWQLTEEGWTDLLAYLKTL
jgi:mono/diheme cytochrome c family protein